MLSRLIPSYLGKGKLIHDPRQFALQAQHLSKYIFARQYGLNTPFSTTAKTYSVSLGDYTDRESEIKVLTSEPGIVLNLISGLIQSAGALKTPKRLKDILPLLEKMLRRHSRCAYLPIRDKTCPSKVVLHCLHLIFAPQGLMPVRRLKPVEVKTWTTPSYL